MSTILNPYISFRDNAREAVEFYQAALGGESEIHPFADTPGAAGPEFDDKVMHASLTTPNGITLMLADTPPGMEFQPGGNISISLSGDDEAELRGYWEKLSAGGSITVPLEKAPWGDTFGMMTDKFGIAWMVNILGSAD